MNIDIKDSTTPGIPDILNEKIINMINTIHNPKNNPIGTYIDIKTLPLDIHFLFYILYSLHIYPLQF